MELENEINYYGFINFCGVLNFVNENYSFEEM